MNSLCTCDKVSWFHAESCPYYSRSDKEYLNGSIVIDTCEKCHVLVSDFEEHWKAMHSD